MKRLLMLIMPGVLLGCSTILLAQGQATLNEFMAINDTAYADENGEFDDWVELHNPYDSPFNLNGIYLTDDLAEPDQYQIILEADSLLQPGAFVIIWCDDDDEQGPFHTNFKLSGDGEEIALVADDGVTVLDSYVFAEQSDDVSMGRLPDGTGEWQILEIYTPGYSNDLSVVYDLQPAALTLLGNYPNPFNPGTTILYKLAHGSPVSLRIYNTSGELVQVPFCGYATAGIHRVNINLSRELASGSYFYTMIAGNNHLTGRMLLVR